MNKSELVASVAEKSQQTATAVAAVLDAFEAAVVSSVAGGDKVVLPGFLSFERAERAARTGRNPSTGETMNIAAATVPRIKAGKAFRDAVAR
ncbi:MAG: HU family DNA-binding protein [Acidobacteria bacterium]|nr:HU family DNA-binding protein [Acidobacteriota bacterium]